MSEPPAQAFAGPPGYGSLVPFNKETHGSSGLGAHGAAFCRGLTGLFVTVTEFVVACRTLPIVFIHPDDGELYPIALTGIERDVNLLVDDDGTWNSDFYCPAYVRRYPFFTVRVTDGEAPRSVVCVDEAGLDSAATPLFDAAGEPSPTWQQLEPLLRELDGAQNQTRALCQALTPLDILEPFEADLTPVTGGRARLRGMLRVNEQRLNALPAERIRTLMEAGFLGRIYAHLISLDNFRHLLDLHVARQRVLAAAAAR